MNTDRDDPYFDGYDWENEASAWYTVRTQPKREEVAARHLRDATTHDCFSPRIRYRKRTRRGKVWFVEALFPGYIFVHCPIHTTLRHILSLHGVTGLVRYGNIIPVVGDSIIQNLRAELSEDLHVVPEDNPVAGDHVEIVGGPFLGMDATVVRTLPARQRVALLLDFLGRQIQLQIQEHQIMQKDLGRDHFPIPKQA